MGPATAASHADRGARQSRRRSGCSAGTSTMQIRTPSGSAIHISSSPTAPASAPAGSAPHARPARVARGQLAHLQPHRHPGRRPCPAPARCRTRGRSPAQRVAVEHPAALRVGWVQQHPAAQHVHGAMIAQQTHPGAQCLLQAAGPSEPETLCREAFSSQAMAVLHDSDTRLTTSLPRRTDPEREDDQRLRWSSAWWSPPPESNRRPHPYHGTTGNRCADRRFPRSRLTVRPKVIGSPPPQLCVHSADPAAALPRLAITGQAVG
jgi:hypothetical protein